MLFKERFLEGIRGGSVTLAFRRWRRPSVKPGGTLLTPVGQLVIDAVIPIAAADISVADAKRAGYDSIDSLLDDLAQHSEGTLYRIELGELRPDPRIALRETVLLDEGEYGKLAGQLRRLDAAGSGLPWTRRTLELIRDRPGVRAGDLAIVLGQDKEDFKLNVRKLKRLGLTESLRTGYHLSRRGLAFVEKGEH